MTKWLRYESAKSSRVYRDIVTDAVDRLTHAGSFAKKDVLGATALDVFDDESIRWDYVKRIIEADHDTELIPMASVFFKEGQRNGRRDTRHGAAFPPAQFPERYIATGYGKKTAGFCIASGENGHFVVHTLKMIRGAVRGKIKKGNRALTVGQRAGIPRLTNETVLELPPPLDE
jgi:hypothetical protein